MTAKILFLDIDGCLSKGRFARFDLSKLDKIRQLIKSPSWKVVLSSGRSQPYMEAMNQVLDLSTPYICENGACVFCPDLAAYEYVKSSPELLQYQAKLKDLDIGTMQFEPGKEFSLSFRVLRDGKVVSAHEIAAWLTAHCSPPSALRITSSSCSIDVVSANVNKRNAATFLVNKWQTDLLSCHGFGDSNNDIELLNAVGHAGAPANANQLIKAAVDFVSDVPDVDGLIDYLGFVAS